MTDDIKDKICHRCKRRKYSVKYMGVDFDWRNCNLNCHKKCADKMKGENNG